MSLPKKIVQTYAKSLFLNVQTFQPKEEKRVLFDVSNVYVTDEMKFTPDIFIIGEELILLRSVITSSKKMKEFFQNPTYSEKQKFNFLLTIFPGLTIPTRSFLKVLTERSMLSLIPEISNEYSKIILEFKKSRKVKLTIASILEENFGSLVLKTLKKLTNSTSILLQVSYTPKILGGLIIEYQSNLIDLSLLKEFGLLLNEI